MRDPSLSMQPALSVVVPAHNSAAHIGDCLDAILSSDLPREAMELIVVDDRSSDQTAAIARARGARVEMIDDGPRGPASARNYGASLSHSPIIAFVDSDVVVHHDALSRMLEDLRDPSVMGVFGSYDEKPAAQGLVSQYRNLLHAFTHSANRGFVSTFWAGLGALRREAFTSVTGFAEATFRHAAIEDVELGYRLTDSGNRILLDPMVLGTHRKRWSLGSMVKTDFMLRGIPWTKVLLERSSLKTRASPSLGVAERLSAAFAVLFVLLLATSLVLVNTIIAIAAGAVLIGFLASSSRFFLWLAKVRGKAFALKVIPLHLLYNIVAVAAFVAGAALYFFSPRVPARYTLHQ